MTRSVLVPLAFAALGLAVSGALLAAWSLSRLRGTGAGVSVACTGLVLAAAGIVLSGMVIGYAA